MDRGVILQYPAKNLTLGEVKVPHPPPRLPTSTLRVGTMLLKLCIMYVCITHAAQKVAQRCGTLSRGHI